MDNSNHLNRRIPTNLQAEPQYPGLDTVVFSIRFPEMTAHCVTHDCDIEVPHLIVNCGMWKEYGNTKGNTLLAC